MEYGEECDLGEVRPEEEVRENKGGQQDTR